MRAGGQEQGVWVRVVVHLGGLQVEHPLLLQHLVQAIAELELCSCPCPALCWHVTALWLRPGLMYAFLLDAAAAVAVAPRGEWPAMHGAGTHMHDCSAVWPAGC